MNEKRIKVEMWNFNHLDFFYISFVHPVTFRPVTKGNRMDNSNRKDDKISTVFIRLTLGIIAVMR